MIHPLTGTCAALAIATVLYTYQSKHEVQLLDRRIAQVARDTDVLRDQSRALETEWTLLESPERLRQFTNQYLTLKSPSPNQFTNLAELPSRLPAPLMMDATAGTTDTTDEADAMAVAGITSKEPPVPVQDPALAPAADTSPSTVAGAEALPIPPLPVPPPGALTAIMAAPSTAATTQVSAPTRIAISSASPSPPPAGPNRAAIAAAEPRPAMHSADVRPAAPRPPVPLAAPAAAPSAANGPVHVAFRSPALGQGQAQPAPQPTQPPYMGSLLGMAHGGVAAPVPLPRPMPISAAQWSNGN